MGPTDRRRRRRRSRASLGRASDLASTLDHSGKPLVDPVDPDAAHRDRVGRGRCAAVPALPRLGDRRGHGSGSLTAVSVAHGNVVAADQGVWTVDESLGVVPAAPPAPVTGIGCNCARDARRRRAAAALSNRRWRIRPLTFATPYDPGATGLDRSFARPAAAPQISVAGRRRSTWRPSKTCWSKRQRCLGSFPRSNGTARRIFASATEPTARAPGSGLGFTATYRSGNGAGGNIGREGLAHVLLTGRAASSGVRNPLAAAGGVDPETKQHIVQVAPFAFQSQLRCVTAAITASWRDAAGVCEARGTMRWTGSWYSAFVSVEPTGAWTSDLADAVDDEVSTCCA